MSRARASGGGGRGIARSGFSSLVALCVLTACAPSSPTDGEADVLAALGLHGIELGMRLDAAEELRPGLEARGYGAYSESIDLGHVEFGFDPWPSMGERQPSSPRSNLRRVWIHAEPSDRSSWDHLVELVTPLRGNATCQERVNVRYDRRSHHLEMHMGEIAVLARREEELHPDGTISGGLRISVGVGGGSRRGLTAVDCRSAVEHYPWHEWSSEGL